MRLNVFLRVFCINSIGYCICFLPHHFSLHFLPFQNKYYICRVILQLIRQSTKEKITDLLFSFLTNKNCTDEGEEKIHSKKFCPTNYCFWRTDRRSRVLYNLHVESAHVFVRRPRCLCQLPHHDSLLSDLVSQFTCEMDQLQRLSRSSG